MHPLDLQKTLEQLTAVLLPAMFVYLLLEVGFLRFRRRALVVGEAGACGIGLVVAGLVSGLLSLFGIAAGVLVLATAGAALSPVEGTLAWPWWIYGWVVYEFWYWVQHWAAHKVRLLWCLHAPHHAPGSIHMLVGANHHFLESVFYFPIFLGFLPALFGVPPLVCVALNLIDVLWGSFLHISDQVVAGGRYGWLERVLQTPAHHRVHHGKNLRYMDTNYNSITVLWDRIFGTLQPLRDEEPVEYGITREVNTASYADLHFGEFSRLWSDVRRADSWREKLGYIFHPPGWKPGDRSGTVAAAKAAGLES